MEDLEINLPVGDDEEVEETFAEPEFEVDGFIQQAEDQEAVAEPEEQVEVAVESDEQQPVGYTAKVVDIEVMQFSRPTDVEAIVNWGEGAVRNEPPFIAVITNKGPILVEQGKYIAKTANGYRVMSQQELDEEFEPNDDSN